jgi:hypothetical protein
VANLDAGIQECTWNHDARNALRIMNSVEEHIGRDVLGSRLIPTMGQKDVETADPLMCMQAEELEREAHVLRS